MIFGNNNHYKIKVLTNKGIEFIDNLYPGDKLYDYRFNKYLIVEKVIPIEYKYICNVIYSDNRSQLIGLDDMIYIGDNYIMQLNDNLNWVHSNIEMREFEFNELQNLLFPDPYTAGLLLFYGDYENKYISLPSDIVNGNSTFSYKYKVEYATILENNKMFFAHKNNLNERITWKEFFPNYNFYAKTHNWNDPIIPLEYQFASLNDRKQFIRAIFDVGYNSEYFPYVNTILHENEYILKEFQKILYSLAIPSKIYYFPTYHYSSDKYPSDVIHNRKYALEIIHSKDNYPGFYYYINHIKNMINSNENEIIPFNKEYKYHIKEVNIIGSGVIDNVILNEKNATYVTDNYLPRISL